MIYVTLVVQLPECKPVAVSVEATVEAGNRPGEMIVTPVHPLPRIACYRELTNAEYLDVELGKDRHKERT